MIKNTLWGLCALATLSTAPLWGAETAKAAQPAAPANVKGSTSTSSSEFVIDPKIQAEIDASPEYKAAWDGLSVEKKQEIISLRANTSVDISTSVTVCGLTISITDIFNPTQIEKDAANCVASGGSSCGAVISDLFEACCPSTAAFGVCGNSFLGAMSSLNNYSSTLASALLTVGFNSTSCSLSPRIPHLGLLAGGSATGNMASCVGTLNMSSEAKDFMSKNLTGNPLSSMSDCGNPRYQLLQNAINWGSTPIDCLAGGAYSDYCTGKESGTPTWGTGCS